MHHNLKFATRRVSPLKIKPLFLIVCSLLLVLFIQISATPAPTINNPLEPPDTSSPQATLKSFRDNINASHQAIIEAYQQYLQEPGLFKSSAVRAQEEKAYIFFERAARCLNVSEVPELLKIDAATEVTLLLKEILDRIDLPYYSQIPDRKVVEQEELSSWEIPGTEIEIAQVQKGQNTGEFLFSPTTVRRANEFYKKIKDLPYKPGAAVNFFEFYTTTPGTLIPPKYFIFLSLPHWLNNVYWEQTLWQWIVIIFNLSITFLAIFKVFVFNWKKVRALNPIKQNLALLPSPLIAIGILRLAEIINYEINITGKVLFLSLTFLEFLIVLMGGLVILFLNNSLGEALIFYGTIHQKKVDTHLIRMLVRLISFGLAGAVVMYGIQQLGINLLPLIAGLGVGGLAIALGAQSTLENIIAGLALFFDNPVSVGEFCTFGDRTGTVESIGLRSIRLRGVDGTLISMPNSAFSQLELINQSRSEKLLLKHTIHLCHQTTTDQLELILDQLQALIISHSEKIDKSGYVRCIGYTEFSIAIEIFAYVNSQNFDEFLIIQQSLLLKVKRIVEEVGTEFAVSG